jgi:secreted trypsin-like serine protease
LDFHAGPNQWTFNIVERIPHPNYVKKYADNDIALFKLGNSITFNEYMIPICLPEESTFTTKKAIASGFGSTGFGEEVSQSLMKVTIDYFSRESCAEIFSSNPKLKNREVDWDRMICAGSSNTSGDTCAGDSGGPLQIFHPNVSCMYTQVGITSFGLAHCGSEGIPGIKFFV